MSSPTAVNASLEATRVACAEALASPELGAIAARLGALGVTVADANALVGAVTAHASTQDPLRRLRDRLAADVPFSDDGTFERVLLLRRAAAALSSLPEHPVSAAVKMLWCDEIQAWIRADDALADGNRVGRAPFADRCMFASLRRFPAGQFDWVRSGLPWSYLLGLRVQDLPMALYVTAAQLKGRSPVFFTHNGYRCFGQSLSEESANRAYYRIARSMELQPEIRGMVGSSWFRSPDVHRATPRLAWLNTVILENGGFAAVHRKPDPNSGVLVRSPTRQQLYDRGEFNPTVGLVIWPRRAMLAWAAAHPHLE